MKKMIITSLLTSVSMVAILAACSTTVLPNVPETEESEASVPPPYYDGEGNETSVENNKVQSSDSKSEINSSESESNSSVSSSNSDSNSNESSSNSEVIAGEDVMVTDSTDKMYENIGTETIVTTSEANFGINDMTEVSTETHSELDEMREKLENGETLGNFEEITTSGTVGEGMASTDTWSYESFDIQDYYCFTDEGNWLKITREMLGEYIPHYKNGKAWGNLKHFDIKFMDACAAVYIKKK